MNLIGVLGGLVLSVSSASAAPEVQGDVVPQLDVDLFRCTEGHCVPMTSVEDEDCLARMEAAMREHDAIDDADLALRRDYSVVPGWLHDPLPSPTVTCLALGGSYHCGDAWPRELSQHSIEAAEQQLEEDKKLLAQRAAYQAEKASKERRLRQRRAAFAQQWDAVKNACWRHP